MNGFDINDLWTFSLVVDGNAVDETYQSDDADYPDHISDDSLEMIELSSDQQVSVSPRSMIQIWGTHTDVDLIYSWFSGRLINAA